MKIINNVSAQDLSWVKSNAHEFEKSNKFIKEVYYPTTTQEFIDILLYFQKSKKEFDIIGCSSNTLFLPSYSREIVICTKELSQWEEDEIAIKCQAGVRIGLLAKKMIQQGCIGFEGLLDLPGTVAAAVYGNAGCRGCSVNELLESFTLLDNSGEIKTLNVKDLDLQYRSTSLKRKELKGVIVEVILKKNHGDAEYLIHKAKEHHAIRLQQQPSGANNLGTTFLGSELTPKGKRLFLLEGYLQKILKNNDTRKSFPLLLKLIGKGRFAPYIYYWNRYMFLDQKSHKIFPKYKAFLETLFVNLQLEIEIRK